MRIFYKKALLFILIEIGLFIFITLLYNHNDKMLFVSNSVSYNAKAEFIKDNFQKIQFSKIIVIGSSMSLNNIDSKQIQDSFKMKTMNLSSWGMKFIDFENFNIWDKKIIININFTDFGSSFVKPKAGFPITNSNILEVFNIISDFNTYRNQYSEVRKYTEEGSEKSYTNLKFDSLGTAYLVNENFKINSSRWKEDIFKKNEISIDKINYFVNSIYEVMKKKNPKHQLVVSFSPNRRCFYNEEKSEIVDYLGQQLGLRIPEIKFINLYKKDISDSCFVDNCHFNQFGNALFTKFLINEIKNKGN